VKLNESKKLLDQRHEEFHSKEMELRMRENDVKKKEAELATGIENIKIHHK
jgi:hypothetical protein